MDGAVYEWNVTSYKREGESVLKSCSYTSVAVSPDSRTTFAVGSDRTLKEICDSQVIKTTGNLRLKFDVDCLQTCFGLRTKFRSFHVIEKLFEYKLPV